MPRTPLLLLVLACACGSTPLLEPPREKIATEFPVVAFYEGRRPSLEKLAVLTVLTPNDEDGIGVVGRILDAERRRDYRPPVKQALLELKPGRYHLEVYYWISHSRFDSRGALVIENLKSATMVPMTIDVAAGGVYFIEPKLRRSEDLSPGEKEKYHPLAFAADFAQVQSPPPDKHRPIETHVWRPRLATIPQPEAKQYNHYR